MYLQCQFELKFAVFNPVYKVSVLQRDHLIDRKTYSSNSCSIRASRPNRQSGVVTKWIPLLRVQVNGVGSLGKGMLSLRIPKT